MGVTQTFTGVYSDPGGISDFVSVRMLFNTSVTAANACYVYYSPGSNLMSLYNDAGTAFLSPKVTPGSAVTVSNSQCTLNGTGSSFSTSGNNLTLNVNLTFSGTFVGQKNVYLYTNGKTANSGWVLKGTWTPAAAGPPTVVSLSPTSGSGLTQTFTGMYSDPGGISDFVSVRMLFNTSVTAANACYVYYSPGSNLMSLYNDAGTAFLSPKVTPGSAVTVSNSQCTLNGTGSSFSTSGNNLTLNVNLTFSGTFVGQKNVYLYTNGKTANSGWVLKGTWTP